MWIVGKNIMTIELKENTFVIGMWFVSHDPAKPVEDRMDWMACVQRSIDPTDDWHLTYRFRYHNSPDPHGEDRKSWYSATIDYTTSVTYIEETMERLVDVIQPQCGGERDYVRVHGDGIKALELIQQRPWCHIETVGTE